MPTEYHIQKRGMKVWQYVTWYDSYEQAKRNFDVLKASQGWSYRIVELKVMDEALLEGEYKDEQDGEDLTPQEAPVIKNSGWGATHAASDWGNAAVISPKPDHGLSGSVWMIHFGLKKKTRVPMAQMNDLMAQGYVKGSPRTVL